MDAKKRIKLRILIGKAAERDHREALLGMNYRVILR
jgi:hypothetical protein